jgi:hypothetical protein
MRPVRRDVYAWKHHFIGGPAGQRGELRQPILPRAGLFLSYDLKPLTADVPGVLVARERIVPISGEAGVGGPSLLRKFEDVYEANRHHARQLIAFRTQQRHKVLLSEPDRMATGQPSSARRFRRFVSLACGAVTRRNSFEPKVFGGPRRATRLAGNDAAPAEFLEATAPKLHCGENLERSTQRKPA